MIRIMNYNTIITFLCIVILLTITSIKIEEKYRDYLSKPTIDIVIARYNENLDWLCDAAIKDKITDSRYKTNFYIYNKGVNNVTPNFMSCYKNIVDVHIIQLENVGRCDHTYLHHVINKYTSLADVTVFLPASCDMEIKQYKTYFIFEKVYRDLNTVFITETQGNIYEGMKDFYIDSWAPSHESNKINQDDTMDLASPRPFGEWYIHVFGNKEMHFNDITYHGILAVSRKHILQRNIQFYRGLITHVDKHHNPEAGHYIERSWSAIFKIPDDRKFKL